MSNIAQRGADLLALYDRALPEVYGYLIVRCPDRTLAQDLTAETFLAAVAARDDAPRTVGWLIGIARHKLADHWRWQAASSACSSRWPPDHRTTIPGTSRWTSCAPARSSTAWGRTTARP